MLFTNYKAEFETQNSSVIFTKTSISKQRTPLDSIIVSYHHEKKKSPNCLIENNEKKKRMADLKGGINEKKVVGLLDIHSCFISILRSLAERIGWKTFYVLSYSRLYQRARDSICTGRGVLQSNKSLLPFPILNAWITWMRNKQGSSVLASDTGYQIYVYMYVYTQKRKTVRGGVHFRFLKCRWCCCASLSVYTNRTRSNRGLFLPCSFYMRMRVHCVEMRDREKKKERRSRIAVNL